MIDVEVQRILDVPGIPADEQFSEWVSAVNQDDMEMVIRIVDEVESQQLNNDYRGKDKPTNVLSFPFEAPPAIPVEYLGDLVVCAPVVEREAEEQNKALNDHWAHMIVHGVLHLMGYDHQNESEADEMEGLEIETLARLGIPDPYEDRTANE